MTSNAVLMCGRLINPYRVGPMRDEGGFSSDDIDISKKGERFVREMAIRGDLGKDRQISRSAKRDAVYHGGIAVDHATEYATKVREYNECAKSKFVRNAFRILFAMGRLYLEIVGGAVRLSHFTE